MTLILKQLFAFIKMLNSDTGTNQLAAGMACGIILGFSPILSLQGLLVILLILFFRIQSGAAFLLAFFFKFIAFFLDPAFHALGASLLEQPSLRPLYVLMYNMPLLPLTRFNNSIVMGAGVISLVLAIPGFFVFRYLITQYRVQVLSQFQNTKFWKIVKATSFYKWYAKYNELYG